LKQLLSVVTCEANERIEIKTALFLSTRAFVRLDGAHEIILAFSIRKALILALTLILALAIRNAIILALVIWGWLLLAQIVDQHVDGIVFTIAFSFAVNLLGVC
jgi:hypothetical protein